MSIYMCNEDGGSLKFDKKTHNYERLLADGWRVYVPVQSKVIIGRNLIK